MFSFCSQESGVAVWSHYAKITDNVASATRLQTARTIWGQSFNGTANVDGLIKITANGNTLTMGSQNASWYHFYGTNNIPFIFNGHVCCTGGYSLGTTIYPWSNIYADGTFSTSLVTSTYQNGNQGKCLVNSTAAAGEYVMLYRGHSTNGWFTIGSYQSRFELHYTSQARVDENINSVTYNATLLDESGNMSMPGTIKSVKGIYSDGYVSAKGQNTSSDLRLKDVLQDARPTLRQIAKAPAIRFAWKDGSGIDVGSSAQYWQKILPDVVKERDGWLEMAYGNIALVSAISIAWVVETHEARITRLHR